MTNRFPWRHFAAFAALLCALSVAACGPSQIRKAASTADRVVELCDKGARVVEDLKAGALIDAEDADRIAPLLLDVRGAAVELGAVARSLKGDEPDAASRIKAAVTALADAADRLNEQGVLRVKNEKTRERLRKALAVARLAADVGL